MYTVTSLPAQGTVKKNGTVVGWLYNPANGHYYRNTAPLSWTDANSEAIALGGYLTSIQNSAENQWLVDHFGAFQIARIGFTDQVQEGTFVWTSGQPVTYTNWDSGQPDNQYGAEDYGEIYLSAPSTPGKWNDRRNADLLMRGIIERNDANGILLGFTQEDVNNNQVTYEHYGDTFDTLAAANDSFIFTVSDSSGGTIAPTTFNINTNVVPSVTLVLTGSPLAENGGTAVVSAMLTNASALPVTVQLSFSGAATNNVDYSASGISITIPRARPAAR